MVWGVVARLPWCTSFVRRRGGFCEPVANFGKKMKLPGMHIIQKRSRNVYAKIIYKRVLPSFAKN